MSARDDRLRERLERLARAAADGQSIGPPRDAGSDAGEARELVENLGVIARIAAARPAPSTDDTSTRLLDLASDPARIGPYRIVGRLGEGGMGVVYEAEQTEPVRRHVALKLVKQGMDTKEVVARFTSERQALALMNHPYIAQAFDAGTTEDGRPYFVMELVAGEPLDKYCDRTRLTTEQRLGLFLKVCDAVQHAHQKGVIHRDLKPSNILVTDLAGGPRPKIIDFGVAKAIGGRLSYLSVQTALINVRTPRRSRRCSAAKRSSGWPAISSIA